MRTSRKQGMQSRYFEKCGFVGLSKPNSKRSQPSRVKWGYPSRYNRPALPTNPQRFVSDQRVRQMLPPPEKAFCDACPAAAPQTRILISLVLGCVLDFRPCRSLINEVSCASRLIVVVLSVDAADRGVGYTPVKARPLQGYCYLDTRGPAFVPRGSLD